jgi:hypothetical protein
MSSKRVFCGIRPFASSPFDGISIRKLELDDGQRELYSWGHFPIEADAIEEFIIE